MKKLYPIRKILFGLCLLNTVAVNAQFSGSGSGTEMDPYIITTPTHLDEVRNDLSAYYELGNDIDLTFDTSDPGGAFYNGGEGWDPLGDFSGFFDGKGFSITGLTINRPSESSLGLFSSLNSNSSVSDLSILDADISGTSSLGVLAGASSGTLGSNGHSVTLIAVTGSVIGTGSNVGGLMGSAGSGHNAVLTSVTQSYSTVDVAGESYVGGFIGNISVGITILNCYARGDITGSNLVGGFIGYVGSSLGDESLSITACYSAGLVTASSNFSGFIGLSDTDLTLSDSYWDMETSTIVQNKFVGDIQLGERRTHEFMQQQALFGSSWDFSTIWNIDEGTSYPYLRNNNESPSPLNTPVANTLPFADGIGSETYPWQISTNAHLNSVRDFPNDNFVLNNDLDLTTATSDASGEFYNSGAGWEPIASFAGVLDGGGFTIDGLTIDRSTEAGVGLFNQVAGATIKDLVLSNATVHGSSNVGGLAGNVSGVGSPSYFSQIGVEGQISSESGTVGGIFGALTYSDAERCYMNGIVRANGTDNSIVGGIAGALSSSGEQGIGLVNSFAIADITGNEQVGGIVGSANASAISNTYYTGFLSTNETNFDGITGSSANSTRSDSYWDGELTCVISGSSSSAEMRTQALYENWDFSSVWGITEGDLPYLQWMGSLPDFLSPIMVAVALPDLQEQTAYCEIAYPNPAPVVEAACSTEASGTPSVSFPITEVGTTTVTWTFEDVFGNVYIVDQDFTILADDVAPVPDETTLSDLTDECSVTPDSPTATDECSGALNGVADVTFPITNQGTTVVTWTYTDSEGNEATQIQNVIINDTQDPVPDEAQLSDVTEQCELVFLSPPTATDNCLGEIDGVPDITFPITSQGTTLITWTYTDDNGNAVTQEQNIIIVDESEPVPDVTSLPEILTDCDGAVAEPTAPTATDNCAGSITATTDQVFPFTPAVDTQILWQFDDGNGNTAIQFQDVVIIGSDEVSVEESLCEGADFTFPDGTVWTGETTQVSTLRNQQGCDSLITTNITVLPLPEVDLGEEEVFGCVGEELTFSIDESSVEFETYTISTLFGNSSTDRPLTFVFDNTFAATTTTQDVFVTIELTDADGCVGTDQVQLFDNTMINWAIGSIQNNDPDIIISNTILPETADTFEWDFGDGTTNSTDLNPTHTYMENGDYEITLTVSNECGDESLSTFVSIVGIENPLSVEYSDIRIYPNPTSNEIYLETVKPLEFQLHSLDGRQIYAGGTDGMIDVSELSSGQYIIHLLDEGRLMYTEKIIKIN